MIDTFRGMKALSLWQPWATLIAIGAKQVETRSWSTAYRGPLVIHASKYTIELKDLEDAVYHLRPADSYPLRPYQPGTFYYHALRAIYEYEDKKPGAFIPKLPLGAALCIVDLVDCVPTEQIRDSLTIQEIVFGNYSDGRFAWKLENVRRFPSPIPMRGAQGLFNCVVHEVE